MISSIFSNELLYALSWTIIHSLWQVSLISIILYLILKATPRLKSTHRYMMAYGSLSILFLMSLITFTSYYMEAGAVSYLGSFSISSPMPPLESSGGVTESLGLIDYIEYYTPLIVNVWVIGAMVFLLKIIGGFLFIKSLIRNAIDTNPALKLGLDKLKNKYNISRNVLIKESSRINTPMVMGYIKPVILFPIGLVNHLSVSEVESILAHELAHVKRHDFILNIIQMVAEALYYYHPGIWYISSRINAERENCCDDLAIAITGNNISYAKTLVKLQDLKISGKLKPALAYAGNKNTFTQRIMRILNQSSAANQYRDKFLALFLVFASLVLGANNWELNRNATVESPEIYFIDDCPQDASDIKYYLDTIPEKNTFHIKKITDEQNVEMEMDNGEVIKLKIDGKDIDKKDYDKYEVIISELQPKKGKDIVTIFPNCDDNLGAVYLFKDLDNEIIRLDSVLGNLEKEKVNIIRNYWTNDNTFAYEELHEAIIDTIEPGVIAKRYPNRFMREKINIDSVFDLLPEKMPKIYFKNFDGNDEEELVFEFNDDIRIDLQNEMEDVIIELEKSLNQEEVELRLKEMKDKLNRKEIEIELRDRDSRLQKERALLDLRKMYAEEEERVNRIDNKIRIYADELEAQVFPEAATELYFGNRGTATVSDKLTQELLEDRLISREEISKIELTGKFLKINGDKQPKNLWMKYKEIYEEFTGLELSKSSKLKFDIDPQNEVQAVNIFSRRRI